MLGRARRMRGLGILGLNKRNFDYILRYNDRGRYPLVDDKLQTKRLAKDAGIAVPELYGVVRSYGQVKQLPALLERYQDFVIKPASGSGGQGVLVISGRAKQLYRKISGSTISTEELRFYVLNVLSGMYSLGGHPDKAMIEARVDFHPVFEGVSYLGVPDVRIIVFMGVPVMAMVRLPTRLSDGKANLHQGAIGAGIDIAEGKTVAAVWHNKLITEHPDTAHTVIGLQVPRWDELLELAARCYEVTGLGYQGVDIVLDRQRGPLILELNARPGLNIQIANRAGILNRLILVERHLDKLRTIDSRIQFARHHFGTLQRQGNPPD